MASAQIYLLDSIENLGISGIQGHLGKVKAGVAMGLYYYYYYSRLYLSFFNR